MKRKLLILGFLFSVAVNIAVLVTIGYHWLGQRGEGYYPPEGKPFPRGRKLPPRRGEHFPEKLYRELDLSESQIRQMESLRKSLRSKQSKIGRKLQEKRGELINLVKQSKTDSVKINQKLAEIKLLQGNLQELIIDNLIQQKKILTPEQQKKLFSIISRRIHLQERHRRGFKK